MRGGCVQTTLTSVALKPSRPSAEPRVAATTPRAVLRVKNGAAKLPKPPAAAAAEAPGAGAGMERSQSRLSLSASFEALAIYFPCMNSFDDEDAVLWLEAELGAVGLGRKVELEGSTPTPAAFLPHSHGQHTLEKLAGERPFRSRGHTSHCLREKILELEFDSMTRGLEQIPSAS
ncbi:hypothetical protein ACRRTK_013286 [Alexandromys fortis]